MIKMLTIGDENSSCEQLRRMDSRPTLSRGQAFRENDRMGEGVLD